MPDVPGPELTTAAPDLPAKIPFLPQAGYGRAAGEFFSRLVIEVVLLLIPLGLNWLLPRLVFGAAGFDYTDADDHTLPAGLFTYFVSRLGALRWDMSFRGKAATYLSINFICLVLQALYFLPFLLSANI